MSEAIKKDDHRGLQSTTLQRPLTLFAAGLALVCLIGFLQWRSLRSMEDTLGVATAKLEQMRTDAAKIAQLSAAPRLAAGRTRPNDEFLAQIENALSTARIDRSHWQDSNPQPPRRLANSDYKLHATNVYLEDVGLQKLAVFVHALTELDATLTVTAINLTNRGAEKPGYDVDLSVAYRVYTPTCRNARESLCGRVGPNDGMTLPTR